MNATPAWKNIFQETNIPGIWLSWLANAASMTRALEDASGVECQIIVQQEGWQEPWNDETSYLKSASPFCRGEWRSLCWIREVVIVTHQPIMCARSVFPRQLVEQFPELMTLGSQPLGKTIFANNTFQRGPIEVAEISAGQALWERLPSSFRPEKCWARRSLFHTHVAPFLLSEVFLPHIVALRSKMAG